MFPLQNTYTASVYKQTSTATSATASAVLDTLGFDPVAFDTWLESAAATGSNPVTLKLQDCDTANGTFVDITGLVGDATDGFTIPLADTDTPQVIRMNVDMRHRKRYLKVSVTPTVGAQIIGATAVLGNAGDSTVARANQAVVADA